MLLKYSPLRPWPAALPARPGAKTHVTEQISFVRMMTLLQKAKSLRFARTPKRLT
jgi:hypothetical protein